MSTVACQLPSMKILKLTDKYILFINDTAFTFWVGDASQSGNFNKGYWSIAEYDGIIKHLGATPSTIHELIRDVPAWPGFANLDY